MKYTEEVRNRLVFLMDKVADINEQTHKEASFQLTGSDLILCVRDFSGNISMFETVETLTEEQTYRLYRKLEKMSAAPAPNKYN